MEATEEELLDWFYRIGMDDIYTFEEYKQRIKESGTKIIDQEGCVLFDQ